MAEEEVRLTGSFDGDLEAALRRIENRIESVEKTVDELGASAAAAGKAGGAGFEKLGDKAEEAGNKARRAKRPIDEAGDEAAKSGLQAAVASEGFNKLAKGFKKAGKEGGGVGSILKVFKFAGLITGAFALAGGISALGAGAAIAVGGLAPLVGVLGGALPLVLAAKLGMFAFKQGLVASIGPMKDWKKTFDESVGRAVANGGMAKGMTYLTNSLDGFTRVATKGFGGFGAEFGVAAHNVGDLVKSRPFLAQISAIFAGLSPILRFLLSGLIAVAQAFLNIVQAGLPAAQGMAAAFEWIATSLRNWTAEQLASGKLTAWLTHSWELFIQVVGVVVDFVIGLYNVFKIAAGYSRGMGQSIHDMAWEFRQWTASAEGQARITKYFQDSLPALREMGLLLGAVAKGLLGLGANQDIAPLLNQIRTQFLPVLMQLVGNLSGQGGLGPALISAATGIAQLFAGLDFSALTIFVQSIATIVQGLVWLQQNVPGANLVISGLLGGLLGFKLLGPVWTIIGKGADAFKWMTIASTATKDLTAGQKLFQLAIKPLGFLMSGLGKVVMNVVVPALRMIAVAGVGALRALSTALFTTPIGWIILAIIAVIAAIYLLWTKCAWFRDAVKAVWNAIKVAAIAVWDAIKVAISAVVDAVVAAWKWAVNLVMTVWNALKTAWQATVDFVIMVAMWIWDHGLKQVLNVIATGFSIAFSIVKFIVQTVIFFIALQIKIIATVAEYSWKGIVMIVKWAVGVVSAVFNWLVGVLSAAWNWLWANIIKPVIDLFVAAWQNTVTTLTGAWNLLTGAISAGWNWLWTVIIKPVIDFFVNAWNTAMGWIQEKAQIVWLGIQGAIQIFWSWLSPIFEGIKTAGSAVWSFISDAARAVWDGVTKVWNDITGFLGNLWDGLKSRGTAVWDAIKSAASSVGDFVKGVWDGVKSAVAGVWNFLARGWNSIPSVSIPDWVPLIGGKTFSLPKLPMLWRGGTAEGGAAIVGEHGPEPLVVNGRYSGMVGQNGPEIAKIPSGGYVVPNLSTLDALPGLTKTLPRSVASAVSRSVPGYAPRVARDGSAGLAREVRGLAAAVASQVPPVNVYGGGQSTYAEVRRAIKSVQAEAKLTSKYHYSAGAG